MNKCMLVKMKNKYCICIIKETNDLRQIPSKKNDLRQIKFEKRSSKEMHSCLSHPSLTKEFDVKIYIVDSVVYHTCVIHHSSDLSKRLANLYTKYKKL